MKSKEKLASIMDGVADLVDLLHQERSFHQKQADARVAAVQSEKVAEFRGVIENNFDNIEVNDATLQKIAGDPSLSAAFRALTPPATHTTMGASVRRRDKTGSTRQGLSPEDIFERDIIL